MSRKRILPIAAPRYDAGKDSPETVLAEVHRYVLENAVREVGWYSASLGSKRRWSMGLRGGALFLVALSGVLPLLNTLWTETRWPSWGVFPLPMTSLTLFLVLASGLVAIDKFWGFSSGWLRYLRTRQMLENRIEVFHLDWAGAWPSKTGSLSAAEVAGLITIARKFLDDVNLLVGEETNAWIQEFNASLQSLEAQVEKRRAERDAVAGDTGNLDLKLVSEGFESWTAVAADRSQTFTGRTGTLSQVPAGLQVLVVTGRKKGVEFRTQRSVTVAAGQALVMEVSLE